MARSNDFIYSKKSISLLSSKNLNKLPREIRDDLSRITFNSFITAKNKCKAEVIQQSFTINKFYIFVIGQISTFISLFKSEFEKQVFEMFPEVKEKGWHLELKENILNSEANFERKSREIYKKVLNVTVKDYVNNGDNIGFVDIAF